MNQPKPQPSAANAGDIIETALAGADFVGTLYTSPMANPPTMLVCLLHGGGHHSTHPASKGRATSLITNVGAAVLCLDQPGHGQEPLTDADTNFREQLSARRESDEPFIDLILDYNADVAARAVPKWQSALDSLRAAGTLHADTPRTLWGLSMGGAVGLHVLAHTDGFAAAVVGLVGGDYLHHAARHVTTPVRFLLQWDDEMIPRSDSLALFDAIATSEKSLHVNPGGHFGVPPTESREGERFLLDALARSSNERA